MTAGLAGVLSRTILSGSVPDQDLEMVVVARLRAFRRGQAVFAKRPRPAQPAQVLAGFRCAAR
jgi:hypothetical protein